MEPPDSVATVSLPVSSVLERGLRTQLLAALPPMPQGFTLRVVWGAAAPGHLGVFIPPEPWRVACHCSWIWGHSQHTLAPPPLAVLIPPALTFHFC